MTLVLAALAGLMAFSPLRAARSDTEGQATVRIKSVGKTVATLIIPRGQMSITCSSGEVYYDAGKSVATLRGKASLLVFRNKEKLIDLAAEEMVIETTDSRVPAK